MNEAKTYADFLRAELQRQAMAAAGEGIIITVTDYEGNVYEVDLQGPDGWVVEEGFDRERIVGRLGIDKPAEHGQLGSAFREIARVAERGDRTGRELLVIAAETLYRYAAKGGLG